MYIALCDMCEYIYLFESKVAALQAVLVGIGAWRQLLGNLIAGRRSGLGWRHRHLIF